MSRALCMSPHAARRCCSFSRTKHLTCKNRAQHTTAHTAQHSLCIRLLSQLFEPACQQKIESVLRCCITNTAAVVLADRGEVIAAPQPQKHTLFVHLVLLLLLLLLLVKPDTCLMPHLHVSLTQSCCHCCTLRITLLLLLLLLM